MLAKLVDINLDDLKIWLKKLNNPKLAPQKCTQTVFMKSNKVLNS